VISDLRQLTSQPFAINLWVSLEDEGAFRSDAAAFARSLQPLAPAIDQLGGVQPAFEPYAPLRFEDQARVLIDAKVPVFSFIFGIPPREILDECRAQGIVTLGGATTPDEAAMLEQAGVDGIVASGLEAGGHRGSLSALHPEALFGTFSLVPQIADRVRVPVIAAGGIADARGALAAFALGAHAVQMGTAFLGSEESGASKQHREVILQGRAGKTVLTKGLTGRLGRGVQNPLVELVSAPQQELLPYPLQRALVKNLTALAERAGRPELMQFWAGQSAALSRYPDARAFLERLVTELSSVLPAVNSWARVRKSR
jgi:nitronate monooxygenase